MLKKVGWSVFALLLLAFLGLYILFLRADTEMLPMDQNARSEAPGLFVELTDGVTHYDIEGPDSGQVVVLVHGFSVPYYIWDPAFEALADSGFRVIRFDMFGRGYSDRPDVRYDGALFERQIKDLTATLGLTEPFDIAGLSMGGAVAMHFAANNPESVRKIVLLDPAYEASKAPNIPRFIADLYFGAFLLPGMAEGQLSDFVHPERYPDWADRYRVQMQYEGFRRAIVSTIYNFMAEDHLAAYGRVQDLGHPVKLIWGTEDQTVPISGAAIVEMFVDVDFMPVEEAGHLPHIEQADVVIPAMVEFLRSEPDADPDGEPDDND